MPKKSRGSGFGRLNPNAATKRKSGEDEDYRAAEQEKDTQAKRIAREDDDFRRAERDAKRIAREDDDFRRAEQKKDYQANMKPTRSKGPSANRVGVVNRAVFDERGVRVGGVPGMAMKATAGMAANDERTGGERSAS